MIWHVMSWACGIVLGLSFGAFWERRQIRRWLESQALSIRRRSLWALSRDIRDEAHKLGSGKVRCRSCGTITDDLPEALCSSCWWEGK